MNLSKYKALSPRVLARWIADQLRRRRADALEERDWRRRMVLAGRKIQSVHQELSEDISDVRGLKAHLESARPEMERLEQALAASREVFHGLQSSLVEHAEAMTVQIVATTDEADLEVTRARVLELEQAADERDASMRELRARNAALLEEQPRPVVIKTEVTSSADEARLAELEAVSAASAERAEELTTTLESQQAEQRDGELAAEVAKSESDERIAELEAESAASVELMQELTATLESQQAEQRGGELAAEVAKSESDERTAEFEAESAASAERVEELTATLETLQTEQRDGELAAEVAKSESDAHTAELEAESAASAGRVEELTATLESLQAEQRGGELAAEVAKSESDERIAVLEAQVDGAKEYSREQEERRVTLEEASSAFELRVDEMQSLVEVLEMAREVVDETSAKDAAESAARLLGLESYADDLKQTLEVAEKELREERSESAVHEAELIEMTRAHTAQFDGLKERLRTSEMARLDSETRAQQEMMDFSDHTRMRIRGLSASVEERDEKVTGLEMNVSELTQRNTELECAVSEMNELQDEVRSSGAELEAKTARLLDLMRGAGGGSVEDVPLGEELAAEVEESGEC